MPWDPSDLWSQRVGCTGRESSREIDTTGGRGSLFPQSAKAARRGARGKRGSRGLTAPRAGSVQVEQHREVPTPRGIRVAASPGAL